MVVKGCLILFLHPLCIKERWGILSSVNVCGRYDCQHVTSVEQTKTLTSSLQIYCRRARDFVREWAQEQD